MLGDVDGHRTCGGAGAAASVSASADRLGQRHRRDTAIAIAIGFALLILGVAIGATAINPWAGTSEQAPAWTIGGGLWIIFSNLVALQIGAFFAVRAARWPDHHSGMLQGLLVWALAFTVAAGVLGFGVSGVLNNVSPDRAAHAAVNAAQAVTGERTGAAPKLTPSETDAVQDAAALTAWWAFATMVLGAVGAVAGGKLGAAHPDWHHRERISSPRDHPCRQDLGGHRHERDPTLAAGPPAADHPAAVSVPGALARRTVLGAVLLRRRWAIMASRKPRQASAASGRTMPPSAFSSRMPTFIARLSSRSLLMRAPRGPAGAR